MKTAQWRVLCILTVLLAITIKNSLAQTYCTPTSISSSTVNLINGLRIGTATPSLPTANQGYSTNLESPIATVNAGSNLQIYVSGSMPGYTSLVSAYIDFNSDGTFEREVQERTTLYTRVTNTSSATYTFENTANVFIPANTATGQYRLRILANNSTLTNPCPGSAKVKCIDYLIQVNGQACTAPTGDFTVEPNCGSNTFNITANVTSLGNATAVAIKNGTTTLQTRTTTGNVTLGPFTSGSSLNLSIANEANANCTSTAQTITYTCPCTPPAANYSLVPDCDNNRYSIETEVSSLGTANSAAITINGNTFRTISSIGTFNIGPFTSGTTQNINIASASNLSCAGAEQNLTFSCPTCVAPTVTYSVADNCSENNYSVIVDITNLGTSSTLTISNNGSALQTVTQTGTYTFGPFAANTTSNFNIGNSSNPTCSSSSDQLTTGCAPCTPSSALFNTIEDCLNGEFSIQVALANLGTARELAIKNGNTLLTTVSATGNYIVGPFSVGENLVLTLIDSENENCILTSTNLSSTCTPCIAPSASFVINDNCAEQTYSVTLSITDLGSANNVSISNGNLILESISEIGVYTFTGYEIGESLNFRLINEENLSCFLSSETITSNCTPCALPEASFELSPDCDENQFFVNASIISLGSNDLLNFDNIVITTAGNYSFGPYASAEEVTIRLQGNTSNSCFLLSEQLTYTCPTCELPTVTFQTVPACENEQYFITANVTSLGNNTNLVADNQIIENTGEFQFGPYSSGETNTIILTGNATNNCILTSEQLTYTCPTCELPQANFTSVENCENNQFYVSVAILDMGSNSSIAVENLIVNENGDYVVGPFASQETVYVVLRGNSTAECELTSPAITFDCNTIEEPTTSITQSQFIWSIYPNPTSGLLTIQSEMDASFQIVDINGKMILEETIKTGENKINLTNCSNGIYTLKITSSKGIFFSRIAIQN